MERKCKIRALLLLAICIGLAKGPAMAQTPAINIKDAIGIALANNYGLQADSLNLNISRFKNKELAGLYLPQVSLKTSMDYNIANPSQMLPGSFIGQPSKDLVAVKFGTTYSVASGVEVTQNIFKKDLRIKMNAAGLNNEVAQTRYQISKEELVYQVASTYYSLQTNAELIRTTTIDYNNLKEILTIGKAQLESGTMKRIDYETLDISVANKQSQLNQLLTQYQQQMDYFKYELGIPATAKITISDSLKPADNSIQADDIWKREDLHLSQQLIEQKMTEINSVRAERLPVVTSYFKYNLQSQFNDVNKFFNSDYRFKSSAIGLSASVPIFDGNRRKSRLHTAQVELEQLQLQNKQKQQHAQSELASAWTTLENNKAQYQINKHNLDLAEKVFTSRRALFAEGVSSLLELLDSEKDLSQARNQYMQSLIDVQTGQLSVYKANGRLLTDYLETL